MPIYEIYKAMGSNMYDALFWQKFKKIYGLMKLFSVTDIPSVTGLAVMEYLTVWKATSIVIQKLEWNNDSFTQKTLLLL